MNNKTEEKSLNSKELYKTTLVLLKILPMVMVFAYWLMLICFYNDSKYMVVSHLLGTVFAPLAFIYITSYVFRFCAFHRIFIHYYAFISTLNVLDHYLHPYFNHNIVTYLHNGGTFIFIITAIIMYIYKYKREKCVKMLNSCGITDVIE